MSYEHRNADGQLHRIDGPAVEYKDGTKEWWINGKLHRIDGPAVERANGTKAWYIDGELYRIDGPAVERANGRKEWWINGQYVTDEVDIWLNENNITYPFDEDGLFQFKLRWL